MPDFQLSRRAAESPIMSRFVGAQTLLAPEALERFDGALLALAQTEHIGEMLNETASDDGFWPEPGHWKAQYRPYVVRGGILQIPVKGVLLSDFTFAVGSWATGYGYLRRALERGLDDDNVRGIAWLHDSGGGEVSENFDLCDFIWKSRGKKPMRAFCEFSYSASYSLASAADRVLVTRSGGVGSIGVLTMHVDISKALDDAGVRVTLIDAPKGGHKTDSYPYKPLSANGERRMQERVDALYGIFVSTVARNRDISEERVRDTQALTYMADQAVKVGLADGTGVVMDAVAAFSSDLNPNEGNEDMTDKTTAKFSQAELDQAKADGKAEGISEANAAATTATAAAVTTAKADATKAERARIQSITTLEEAKGREGAALSLALTTDMSADQVKPVLAGLPKAAAGEGERSSDSPLGLALGGDKSTKASDVLSPDEVAASINKKK